MCIQIVLPVVSPTERYLRLCWTKTEPKFSTT
jgi:hypothetical protein